MITTFAGCAKRNFAAVERCIEPITEIRLVSQLVDPWVCLRRQASHRRSTPCAQRILKPTPFAQKDQICAIEDHCRRVRSKFARFRSSASVVML